MKHARPAQAALALLGLASTGCLIISADRTVAPAPSPQASYPPTMEYGPDDLVVREVDAASGLTFEPSRVEALTRIARRVPLRPDVQARIVWAAYLRLDFEPNKVGVIKAVLDNPSCDDAARAAVLDGLGRLNFEPNRRELLERVSQRAG